MTDIAEHSKFLGYVRDYIKNNPEVSPYVTEFISQGISAALRESQERAGDMECALLGMVDMPKRTGMRLALDKIKKWNGKSSLKWDSSIQRLEFKLKP